MKRSSEQSLSKEVLITKRQSLQVHNSKSHSAGKLGVKSVGSMTGTFWHPLRTVAWS